MLYTLLVGRPPFDVSPALHYSNCWTWSIVFLVLQMDGVKNTLNRVVSAEFELPDHLSLVAKDLINCLLKKVCVYINNILIMVCDLNVLQHPAHRLKLSQILDHPFMKEQSEPQPTANRDTPLLHNHHLMRGAHPGSLASLDSGHATQYTQSTSTHTVNSRGPVRATVRPRGIAGHIPSTVCSVSSNSSTSSRRTHSRHRSLTPPQATTGVQPSDLDAVPFRGSSNGGVSHHRSQSMEALQSQEAGDCENCSCHSHSSSRTASTGGRTTVLSARNTYVGVEGSKKHSTSCGELKSHTDYNKENESAVMNSTRRKAKSEMDSVNGQRRQRLGSSGAPFGDRTNNVRTENGKKKSNVVATADKPVVKTLNELVPPLNAARLRPIQQQTRSANVSIFLWDKKLSD